LAPSLRRPSVGSRTTASNLDTLLDRGVGRRVRMLLSFQRPSHRFVEGHPPWARPASPRGQGGPMSIARVRGIWEGIPGSPSFSAAAAGSGNRARKKFSWTGASTVGQGGATRSPAPSPSAFAAGRRSRSARAAARFRGRARRRGRALSPMAQ